MTACTNHGGKARRVVTAALVGVLSVGTVPMAALAEGVSDAISPLFAEGGIDGTDFSAGEATPTLTQDSNGDGIFGGTADQSIVCRKNEDGVWEVAATGEAIKVDVDMIVVPSGDPVNIDSSNVRDYKVRVYKADEDGNPTGGALSGNKIVDAGEYVITVTALTGSPYAGQTFKTNIVVKGQDLPTGIVAFENGEKADMDFTFTGSALDIDFKYDPDTTDAPSSPWAVLDEGTEYTVTYKKNGQTVDSVTDAGTYVATLTGKGKYAGSQADVTIVVDKFVIDSNATVEIAPFEESAGDHPVSVSRKDDDGFTVELDPVLVSIAPQTSTSAPGPYKFDLTTSDSANVSIVSGTTATGRKVENLATFTYKNEALADAYELDHSKGEEFDTSDIEAFNGKTEITNGVNVNVDLVKAADEDGENWAYTGNDENDLNAGLPGIYRVVVKVEDTTSSKYAGTAVFTVTVYKGSLDADASVYVYGPETSSATPVAITEYAKGYDGEVLSTASFGVVSKGVKPSDLEKKLVDSDGDKVEEAVNAGSYKLVVTSDWYKLSGTTELPVTIGKVDLNSMRVGALKKWNTVAGESVLFLPVGGIDCTTVSGTIDGLGLVYATGIDGAAYAEKGYNKDDFKGEDEVPDVVDTLVEYDDNGTWKEVGEIDQSGRYRVTVTVAEDIAGNFTASTKTLDFTVAKPAFFKDVQPGAWYYNVVQAAYDEGYMNGTTAPSLKPVYDDSGNFDHYEWETGVFTPEGTLTRAQVAAVLFNASGADVDETGGAWNEHTGWDTGFSDVDGTQWYGKAVYWAKQNGVINGYADGTFQADKPVTREEFLSMLANYAEVVLGDDTVGAVSTDVLAEFPDGSSVAGWAAENVAWAAEKGIAGNGGTLMPADTMTRAYCAAMMINYLNPELAK